MSSPRTSVHLDGMAPAQNQYQGVVTGANQAPSNEQKEWPKTFIAVVVAQALIIIVLFMVIFHHVPAHKPVSPGRLFLYNLDCRDCFRS